MANSNLAAIVTSDDGPLVLIYQDARIRVKFPSGNCIDARVNGGIQAAIAAAKDAADAFCRAAALAPPNCRTWFVPTTPGFDLLDWLTLTVGLEIEVNPIGEDA